MEEMLTRFSEQAPVAVMARLGLQRAIGAEWVNEVFEEHSKSQYTRELLFSTVVELMSLVALGMRPSLHAAAQKMRDDLPVSLTALYDKVNRVETDVVRALASGSAARLAPVIAPLRRGATPTLPGLTQQPASAAPRSSGTAASRGRRRRQRGAVRRFMVLLGRRGAAPGSGPALDRRHWPGVRTIPLKIATARN